MPKSSDAARSASPRTERRRKTVSSQSAAAVDSTVATSNHCTITLPTWNLALLQSGMWMSRDSAPKPATRNAFGR